MFLSKSKTIKLTENQETKIIETCLDWLIQDEKVAAKAYSMITLYNFGKKHSWINEELKAILLQDYFKHSAAYRAAAKEILEKLK
jgi:ferritin-like protein